jgi:putative ABC transport system substrate-binding protein
VGRNVRIDYRWGASNSDPDRMRKDAAELLALAPDIVLATTAPIVVALQQVSRTVPIAFGGVIDPVGSGLVASLARPGGNATGFLMFEYGIGAKWLELLKEISSGVKRVAVLREATLAGIGQLAAMQTASPSFGVELHPIDVSDAGEIERALADFARAPNGGLIVPLSTSAISHRKLIVALAARHQLPAVYPSRLDAAVGGLISYGPDGIDTYRRVAGYVDRILKGEKPAGSIPAPPGSHGRPGAPPRGGDRHPRLQPRRPGGKSCNHDHPDRLRRWRRPGQARPDRQPCPAGRQCDRH